MSSAVTRAASLLLGEFEEVAEEAFEVERRLSALRRRQGELRSALQQMMRSMPGSTSQPVLARVARIESAFRPAGRRRGGTELTRAALRFLAEGYHETIRAAELEFYLVREGIEVPNRRHLSTLLADWAKAGLVTRTGHGLYRVEHMHKDLIDTHLELLEG